ncbi:MAG: nucleotide exchange factor GrpE [Bacilli bacterium]|nr:nucleotide exchange factor GrpE [Bacilli bacterium]
MTENNRYREEEKELEQETPQEEPVQEEQVQEEQPSKKEDKTEKNKRIKKLQERIAELEESEAVLKNELLKDRAELENFKRRMNEERIKDRKYASQDVFSEIINVLDIFDKAVNLETEDQTLKNFLIGFVMINNQFATILENYGVKKIKAVGEKFDPAYHSAIETVETEDVESGVVLEEVMTGYLYKDRVLRPSMVKVSTKKEN